MRKKEEKEEEEEEGFREKKTAMSRCLENLISCAHARSRTLARAPGAGGAPRQAQVYGV